MPTRRVGENVPRRHLPDRLPAAGDHHVRARDAAIQRLQPAQHPAGTGGPLGDQGVAPPERRLVPADRPARARLHRGDLQREVLPVQRIPHLGAKGVPGAEPGRLGAEVGARGEQGVPQRPRSRPTQEAARSRARPCSRCGTPPPAGLAQSASTQLMYGCPFGRPRAPSSSAERGPCTASTPYASCSSVTARSAGRPRPAGGRPPPCSRRWVRGTRRRPNGDRRSGRRPLPRRRRSRACTAPAQARSGRARSSGRSRRRQPPPPDHGRLAEVADVEDADRLPDRRVLLEHAGSCVLDRHLPPAEVGELGAESHVPVVEG